MTCLTTGHKPLWHVFTPMIQWWYPVVMSVLSVISVTHLNVRSCEFRWVECLRHPADGASEMQIITFTPSCSWDLYSGSILFSRFIWCFPRWHFFKINPIKQILHSSVMCMRLYQSIICACVNLWLRRD